MCEFNSMTAKSIIVIVLLCMSAAYGTINKNIPFASLKTSKNVVNTLNISVSLPSRLENTSNSICLFDSIKIYWNDWCEDCVLGVYHHRQNPPKSVQLLDICDIYNSDVNSFRKHNPYFDAESGMCHLNHSFGYQSSGYDSKEQIYNSSKYIRCLSNEDHCIPRTDKISINNNKLIIEFVDEIQHPQVDSLQDLELMLNATPPFIHQSGTTLDLLKLEYSGEWNNNTMVITAPVEYINRIYDAHTKQEPIAYIPKLHPSHVDYKLNSIEKRIEKCRCGGSVSLRMFQMGVSSFFVIDQSNMEIVSNVVVWSDDAAANSERSVDLDVGFVDSYGGGDVSNIKLARMFTVDVVSCQQEVLLWSNSKIVGGAGTGADLKLRSDGSMEPDADKDSNLGYSIVTDASLADAQTNQTSASSSGGWDSMSTQKVVVGGVVSLTGHHLANVLIYPHDLINGMVTGTWSLSFWLHPQFSADSDPESVGMRTLFYKGIFDGSNPSRSPSAWLLPNHRITLRVSTDKAVDVGVETVQAIQENSWNLITFVFRNYTHDYLESMGLLDAQVADSNSSPESGAVKEIGVEQHLSFSSPAEDMEFSVAEIEREHAWLQGTTCMNVCTVGTDVTLSQTCNAFPFWLELLVYLRSDEVNVDFRTESIEITSPFNSTATKPEFELPAVSTAISIYINGKLDITVSYRDTVLGNTHPMHMFKDISHSGPVGFVKDIMFIDHALEALDVLQLYSGSSSSSSGGFSKAKTGAVSATDANNINTDSAYLEDTLKLLHCTPLLGGTRPHHCETDFGIGHSDLESEFKWGSGSSYDSEYQYYRRKYTFQNRAEQLGMDSDDGWSDFEKEVPPDEMGGMLLTKILSESRACAYSTVAAKLDLYAEVSEIFDSNAGLYYWGMVEGFGVENAENGCGIQLHDHGGGDKEPVGSSVSVGGEMLWEMMNVGAEVSWNWLTGNMEEGVNGCAEHEHDHFGGRDSNERCGRQNSTKGVSIGAALWNKVLGLMYPQSAEHIVTETPPPLNTLRHTQSQKKLYNTFIALTIAADLGIVEALVPLSTMLSSGLGVVQWLEEYQSMDRLQRELLHRHDGANTTHEDAHVVRMQLEFIDMLSADSDIPLSSHMIQQLRNKVLHSNMLLFSMTEMLLSELEINVNIDSGQERGSSARALVDRKATSPMLQDGSTFTNTHSQYRYKHVPMAASAMCWLYGCKPPVGFGVKPNIMGTDRISGLVVGFLHVASMHNQQEAHNMLGYRYKHGFGVVPNDETAAVYLLRATTYALDEFHRVGLQPIVERDRLDEHTDDKVELGNTGSEDALIQAQIIRAQEGDVAAMTATGDLFYYGARGLPRDQPRALSYFQQAAELGSVDGLCGAANMFLKGEGTSPPGFKNATYAIELYERALAESSGSIRALNGLGYIYFYGLGDEVEKNETKAFYYFLAAAEMETDADSLFNTGYCLEMGLGVTQDQARAFHFYSIAANKFGNFGAIKQLGIMYMQGVAVIRSLPNALKYLVAGAAGGPWGGWLRRGLDSYLSKRHSSALFCYLHGGEHGYEVSQANAAWILQKKMVALRRRGETNKAVIGTSGSLTDIDRSAVVSNHYHALYLRQLLLSAYHQNLESFVKIGHVYMTSNQYTYLNNSYGRWFGLYGASSVHAAVYYYSKASAYGHGLANLYIGAIYQFRSLVPSQRTGEYDNVKDSGGDMVAATSTNSQGYKHYDLYNIRRANKYYVQALSNPTLPPAFYYITQGLIYLTNQILDSEQTNGNVHSYWITTLSNIIEYMYVLIIKY